MLRMATRSRVIGALGWVLAACGVVLAGHQATPTQSPQVFRTAVNLVPVDVRVLDRNGQPVTDLKESEFIVLENNVRQQVRHFSTTMFQPDKAPAAGQPLLRTNETPQIGTQNRRVFLIVLGRGRLQPPAKGVDAALELIKKHLLPQDYVGVMAWNRATDLTTDHAKVEDVVERFKKNHEKVEALLRQHFSGLAAIYGGSDIPPAIQKEIDGVFGGPAAPGVRTIPPEAVANASRMAGDTRRTTDALQTQAINAATGSTMMTSLGDTTATLGLDMSLDEFVEVNSQTMQDVANLYTGIGYLRHVNGEKHLLFVSQEGLMLPRAEDDKGIAAIAADARVVLDILHTGGTNPRGGIDWRIPTSRTISELSGGQFTSVQMGPAFVERVAEASRFQYTLGYYPANGEMDGRYRRIIVRVTRPGVRVLYRHGYYARQFQSGFDRQRLINYSRVTAAASYSMAVPDIPLVLLDAKGGKTADGGREVIVQLKISPERLSLTETNGRKKGSIDVAIFCADAGQRLIGVGWETIEFEMTPDAYQRFMQNGLTYTGRVGVTAEPRHVKVVVYDPGADLVGSAMRPIK